MEDESRSHKEERHVRTQHREEMKISPDVLLDSLFDGVYYVDVQRCISYWNKAAERITGYSRDEVVGSRCADNILKHIDCAGRAVCDSECPLSGSLQDGNRREITAMLHHKEGYRLPVQIRTSPVRDEQGEIVGVVEIFTDNSNTMQVLEELEKLKHDVFVDVLTGAGNRRYGEMTLDSRVYEWRTHKLPFGVLFFDVDHFKSINDRYGHATGDDVLTMVARSAANVLRKHDILSRWGGEEFIAILSGANQGTLISMAERIRRTVEQSYIMRGTDNISVTVSIGGTIVNIDDSVKSVVARADDNMYQSKKDGRNRVTIR